MEIARPPGIYVLNRFVFHVKTHLFRPDTPRGRRVTRSVRTAFAALGESQVARLNRDPSRWLRRLKLRILGLTKIAENLPEYLATGGLPRADVNWNDVADAARQDWDDAAQGLGSELSR